MNGEAKAPEPALAMICLPTKQEPQQQSRNFPPGSQIPAETVVTAIDAWPLQSLAPSTKKPLENGSGDGEDEKKPEKEHKKRSKNWTRIETMKLIRIRSEMEPRFCRSVRKSELWDEISELLRNEGMCRDAQQCRDKWEKLTAAYKEVRDGVRDKEDYPFYEDLDPILSGKVQRRESQRVELPQPQPHEVEIGSDGEETEDAADFPPPRKRRRSSNGVDTIEVLKELLESLMAQQHRMFVDLMESMERREKIREKIRQEREEKWREEDRAQRLVFQNAMLMLTKKLVNDGSGEEAPPPAAVGSGEGTMKKRSKNWKRAEVLLLIKLRTEMEGRFEKSVRRAALWDELARLMCAEGAKRDGKQCREKWDKLMAEFKDVSDGKRDRIDSPFYAHLLTRRGATASTSLDNPTAEIE